MSQYYSVYDSDLISHPTVLSGETTDSGLENSDDYLFYQSPSSSARYSLSSAMNRDESSGQSSSPDSTKLPAKKLPHLPYPPLPAPIYYSAFTQPERFETYVNMQSPSFAFETTPLASTQLAALKSSEKSESLQARIDSKYMESAIKDIAECPCVDSLDWVCKALFPDTAIPIKYEEDRVLESDFWLDGQQVFTPPPTDMKEVSMADWLNNLCVSIGTLHGVFEDQALRKVKQGFSYRSWDPHSHNRGPAGAIQYSKPDITLIDHSLKSSLSPDTRRKWQYLHAIIEVSTKSARPDLLRSIIRKASSVFETQPYRRFFCGLGFKGDPSAPHFFFVLIDRSGSTFTKMFALNSYSALKLGRILYYLAFAPAEGIGCDTTMVLEPSDYRVLKIRVKDTTEEKRELQEETFLVVKEIHRPFTLHGRGTRVFIVKGESTGKFFILKDSWILASHEISEIKQLCKITAVVTENPDNKKLKRICPTIYMGQDLGDRTNRRRGAIPNIPSARIHRRIVSGPVGDPITTFRSRKEFIKVMIDIIEFLEFLDSKCGVVHGDISMHNLVINRTPASASPNDPPVLHSGVDGEIDAYGSPIDYDYCRPKDMPFCHTSGTKPYMSLQSLNVPTGTDFIHTPSDDLESLLYIMLGICHFTDGPCGQVREASKDTNKVLPICGWYEVAESRHWLGRKKCITLESFKDDIEPNLSAYWAPFAPYLQRLIRATFGDVVPYHASRNKATHAEYKSILQDAHKDLPPENPSPYARILVPKRNRDDSRDGRKVKSRRLDAGSVST